MKNDQSIRQDDAIDRAAQAIRGAPVPDGPTPEVLEAVRKLCDSAPIFLKPTTIRERILTMNRITKLAAAVLVVAVLGGLAVWLTLGDGGASVAWADVQEKIRTIQTMRCTLVVQNKPKGEMTIKMMFLKPGILRQEIATPHKIVSIINMQEGKILTLVEAEKKAIMMSISGMPKEELEKARKEDFLAEMKELIEKPHKELGEKEIDGRTVKGFELQKDGLTFELWVDARTALPVTVEARNLGGDMFFTMSDFEFGVKLDENLFKLEVPKGYEETEQTLDVKPPSAKELFELLETWAKARGGTFPDAINPIGLSNDMRKIDPKTAKELFGKGDEAAKAGMKLGGRFAGTMLLLQKHPEARYVGKGVKLGDGKSAIFWYKPKDAESYLVIYGDGIIKELAEEDLPAEPEEAEAPATP